MTHFCKHEISTAKSCISSSLDFSVCAFGFDRIQTINLKLNMDICHIWDDDGDDGDDEDGDGDGDDQW